MASSNDWDDALPEQHSPANSCAALQRKTLETAAGFTRLRLETIA
jgi:hypothetical protein